MHKPSCQKNYNIGTNFANQSLKNSNQEIHPVGKDKMFQSREVLGAMNVTRVWIEQINEVEGDMQSRGITELVGRSSCS